MALPYKALLVLPLILWLLALYFSLEVMMTRRRDLNLLSPDDIRQKSNEILDAKQKNLQAAFWCLAVGLVLAILLLAFRLHLKA
jgi:hypothetical protein